MPSHTLLNATRESSDANLIKISTREKVGGVNIMKKDIPYRKWCSCFDGDGSSVGDAICALRLDHGRDGSVR